MLKQPHAIVLKPRLNCFSNFKIANVFGGALGGHTDGEESADAKKSSEDYHEHFIRRRLYLGNDPKDLEDPN